MNQFETLCDLLSSLLALGCLQLLFQLCDQLIQINLLENIPDRLRAHFGHKGVTKLILCLAVLSLREQLFWFERGLPFIDHKVILVINNPFQISRCHVHHQSQSTGHTFVEPNVTHGDSEFDMPHPLASNTSQCHFHAATIANNTLKFDPFVLSARTLVVLRRPENPFAEQTAFFGLKRPIIDGFRIFGLSSTPGKNRFRRSDSNTDFVKTYTSLHSEDFAGRLGLLVHGIVYFWVIGFRPMRRGYRVSVDLHPQHDSAHRL